MINLEFYESIDIFHQSHQLNLDNSFADIISNFEKNIKKNEFGSISLYYGKNFNQFKIYTLLFYENKIINYDLNFESFMKHFKKINPDTICQIDNNENKNFVSYILTYFDEDFDKKMNEILYKKENE